MIRKRITFSHIEIFKKSKRKMNLILKKVKMGNRKMKLSLRVPPAETRLTVYRRLET